jgi:hypothetical protein
VGRWGSKANRTAEMRKPRQRLLAVKREGWGSPRIDQSPWLGARGARECRFQHVVSVLRLGWMHLELATGYIRCGRMDGDSTSQTR